MKAWLAKRDGALWRSSRLRSRRDTKGALEYGALAVDTTSASGKFARAPPGAAVALPEIRRFPALCGASRARAEPWRGLARHRGSDAQSHMASPSKIRHNRGDSRRRPRSRPPRRPDKRDPTLAEIRNFLPVTRRRALSALSSLAGLAAPGWADPPAPSPRPTPGETESHGLSIFGELAETADFPHFAYVNPSAPKGGTLVMEPPPPEKNSYDSLNPYILRGNPAAGVGLIYDTLMTGEPRRARRALWARGEKGAHLRRQAHLHISPAQGGALPRRLAADRA